jgi:hypothetical protein
MARIHSIWPIGVAIVFVFCSQAHAQGLRYSLSPRAPFPCGAVSFDGDNIVFRRTMVFVCNGKEQLEMPAGSIMGVNAICSGTALILSHAVSGPGSLFNIVRRCSRPRPRR